MSHSYIRVYVHCVWATKGRERVITREVQPRLEEHIKAYSSHNSIVVDRISVQIDHVHVLLSLKSNQQLDMVLQLLKGESSHWMNASKMIRGRFSWQRGFAAFSVGLFQLDRVRQYIDRQDEHHGQRSFLEEYSQVLTASGVDLIPEHLPGESHDHGSR